MLKRCLKYYLNSVPAYLLSILGNLLHFLYLYYLKTTYLIQQKGNIRQGKEIICKYMFRCNIFNLDFDAKIEGYISFD